MRTSSANTPIRRVLALALLALVVLAGCSSKKAATSGGLPAASGLLSQSAQTMAGVTSAHFSLQVDGPLSPLPVKSADGVIARGGKAKASATVSVLGQLVSYQVVESGGKAYLKGPTGGFQTLPATEFYDISQLLDPQRGVASLLMQATNGRTEARESVNGVDCYRVTASVPTAVLVGLTQLAPGQDAVTATLWLEVNGGHLIQAKVPFKTAGANRNTTLTALLSEFNVAVDIQAPTTQ